MSEQTSTNLSTGTDSNRFYYENIDTISPNFYEGMADGDEFLPASQDIVIDVPLDGNVFHVDIKTEKMMNSVLKRFKNALIGKKVRGDYYDPNDVFPDKYEAYELNGRIEQLYIDSDAKLLNNDQLAHRTCVFAKVNELIKLQNVAAYILKEAPKKKNGTLAIKRITRIASLFCMNSEGKMFCFYAVAKSDLDLKIEIREDCSNEESKIYNDLFMITNLFQNC